MKKGFGGFYFLLEMLPIFITIIAYGSIGLAIINAPWFSWSENALSDLGARAGSNFIFNTGLIISGILLMVYVSYIALDYLDYKALHGIIFLFLSGLCLMSIGLFPEQVEELHFAVSLGFFVSFPIGQLLLSLYLKYSRGHNILIVLGLVSFFGSLIIWSFPWESIGVTGVAIPEFLSSFIGVLWLLTLSYIRFKEKKYLFRQS